MNQTPPSSISSPEIVQLHVAEYNAIMARNVNWLTLISGTWALLFAFVGTLAVIPESVRHAIDPRVLAWGSVAVILTIIGQYYGLTAEQYRGILYIQQRLRPQLKALTGDGEFWNWEHWIHGFRSSHSPIWWEGGPLLVPLVAIAFAAKDRLGATVAWQDWVAFATAILGLAFEARFAWNVARIRQALLADGSAQPGHDEAASSRAK